MTAAKLAIMVLAFMPAACAPTTAGQAGESSPDLSAGQCEASKVQSLVGQSATSELAGQARQSSGASVVRWLRPGQMVTMEYRADRLNIELDERNRVVAIRCG